MSAAQLPLSAPTKQFQLWFTYDVLEHLHLYPFHDPPHPLTSNTTARVLMSVRSSTRAMSGRSTVSCRVSRPVAAAAADSPPEAGVLLRGASRVVGR